MQWEITTQTGNRIYRSGKFTIKSQKSYILLMDGVEVGIYKTSSDAKDAAEVIDDIESKKVESAQETKRTE